MVTEDVVVGTEWIDVSMSIGGTFVAVMNNSPVEIFVRVGVSTTKGVRVCSGDALKAGSSISMRTNKPSVEVTVNVVKD